MWPKYIFHHTSPTEMCFRYKKNLYCPLSLFPSTHRPTTYTHHHHRTGYNSGKNTFFSFGSKTCSFFLSFMTFLFFSLFVHDLQCHGGGGGGAVVGQIKKRKTRKKILHIPFFSTTYFPTKSVYAIHSSTQDCSAAVDCYHNNNIWSDYRFLKIAATYFFQIVMICHAAAQEVKIYKKKK